jgi:hypothetical protein
MGPESQAILDLIVEPQQEETKPSPPQAEEPVQEAADEADATLEDTGADDDPSDEEPDQDDADTSEDELLQTLTEDDLDLGPVSRWPAEDREVFMSLPEEARDIWLKRVRQQEAAFTRSTQEHSQRQRALDDGIAQTQQLISQLGERTSAVDQALGQMVQLEQAGLLPQEPDPSLLETDPVAYQQQDALFRRAVSTVQALTQERKRLFEEHQRQVASQQQQHLQVEAKKLLEYVPEFADPDLTKRQNFRDGVAHMLATNFDVSTDDLSRISDNRVMRLAAAHYRLLQKLDSAKATLQKRRKGTGEQAGNLRPGPAQRGEKGKATSNRKKARQLTAQMKKTGSIDDVAAWIGGPS